MNLERVLRGIQNPNLVVQVLNQQMNQRRFPDGNPNGQDVFSADWDALLVLDACRFDMFEAVAGSLPGNFERRESLGSATPEWLLRNFDGRDLTDTVYVTANPQLPRNDMGIETKLHAVVNLWEDEWDDEVGSVRPEVVADAALQARKSFPNKRLLVHFMQPHHPFIGEVGQTHIPERSAVWHKVAAGELSADNQTLWEAYRENLELVLPSLKRLLSELDGKTVTTSDHGNLVDERMSPLPARTYGHPKYIYTEPLVAVPWHVVEQGKRHRIVAEEPESSDALIGSDDSVDGVVEDRLADLGYV